MKRISTFQKWLALLLLFIATASYAQAQYPKKLSQYPVTSNNTETINTMAQNGNAVYLGGNFTKLNKHPLLNQLIYPNLSDTTVVVNQFAVPDKSASISLPDGSGGWYIFGKFGKLGDADRKGGAQLNADGTVSAFDPQMITDDYTTFGNSLKINSNIIICGSFSQIAGNTYPGIAALDATTGQPLSGWQNIAGLNSNPVGIVKSTASDKLFLLGAPFSQNNIQVLNINDLSNPQVISDFKIDAIDKLSTVNGGPLPLTYTQVAYSDNMLYLSGWGYDDNFSQVYDNQTVDGKSFDSHLFIVDAATGKFNRAINTGLETTDQVQSLLIDDSRIYLTYTSADYYTHLKIIDKNTGNDLTPPGISNSGFQLYLDSKQHLVIYNGSSKVNGVDRSVLVINLADLSISDWNPTVFKFDADLPGAITSFSESDNKIYVGGDVRKVLKTYPVKALAAMDANTGEVFGIADNLDLSGTIKTLAIKDNTLYVGGVFTAGDYQNLAAFDISDPLHPKLSTNWKPNPDATINALLVKDNHLFAGGDFSNIDGQALNKVADFDISNNTTPVININWKPSPDAMVNAFTFLDQTLYIGGSFKKIGGTARESVAAFDFSNNGQLTSWNPMLADDFNNQHDVYTLAAQPADGGNHAARIFIGGSNAFNLAGAEKTSITPGFAVVNATDGKLDAWQLPVQGSEISSNAKFYNLNLAKNKLYLAGLLIFRSTDVSGNFAQIDPTEVIPFFDGTVNTSLVKNNLLFVGGDSFQSSFNDPALNGLVVFQTGDLAPELTFNNFTKTYGDEVFAPAATSTVDTNPITYSIADGDNADDVISLADGKITILKPGAAKITASQTGATDVKATITINKAELTIHPQNATTVVNQNFPDFPFTLTGWKNGDDTKTGIVSGKPEFTSTGSASSPAGTYDLTINSTGTLASDYYTFTPSADKATLTINTTGDKAQTITFAAIANKTYGDADIDAGATSDSGLPVSYSSSDEKIATIVNGKIHISGAGSVTITALQAGDPTYEPAAAVPQTLTVAKAALNIKADDKVKNRGENNPVFTATYTGFVNGDKVTNLTTAPTITTTATTTSAPGTYPITVADATSANYEITFAGGTLTIKGTQIITFAPLSTLTYGDAAFDPGATSDAGSPLKPVYTTDNPSVITIENGQAVIKGAGTANITATFAAANGFDLTTAKEPVTVLKKQLIITAQDKSRNYGEANPVFTFTYQGFVYNDNATSGGLAVQPAATTTAIATSVAGVYPISVSGASANNYDILYVNGSLTINSITRTITFNALSSRTYGAADFDPAATSNTNEIPTYTSSNTAVAAIVGGQVHIVGAGTTTITANYPNGGGYAGASSASQALTVNKANLVISADNKTKTQGPPDIVLTASYSGFVNGDNATNLASLPVLTTTAKANSSTGTYPIEVSAATSDNYNITYHSGIMTIVLGDGQDEVVIASQALSPDGDGVNDYFQIGGINNFPTNHVTIINRNGVQVWEASGYDNSTRKFDGHTNGGNQLQQGTYYYLVNYTVNGQQKKKSGYLILKF